MFEFFKEFDAEIYKEITEEVEFNMWNDRSVSIIQSEIEKVIKKLFKESDIVLTNVGKDNKVYREYNPPLSRLLNEDVFREFLTTNNILSYDEIENYWKILNARNDKEHGNKANREKIEITLKMKRDSYKYLFDLCYNAYTYKFKKAPNTHWDEEHFEKLLEKPTEKIIEIEKPVEIEKIVEVEKVVEKIIEIEKPIEIKIKDTEEIDRLQAKIKLLEKSTPKTSLDLNLLSKLELGNSCLAKKDFENAKIAFTNCINIDISCLDAYLGFIMVDNKSSNLEELIHTSQSPIDDNKNYKNALSFCSSEEINKIKEINQLIKENIDYKKYNGIYNIAKNNLDNENYFEALNGFSNCLEYKDAKELFDFTIDTYIESIIKKAQNAYYNKYYQTAYNHINNCIKSLKENKIKAKDAKLLNLKEKIEKSEKEHFNRLNSSYLKAYKTQSYDELITELNNTKISHFKPEYNKELTRIKDEIIKSKHEQQVTNIMLVINTEVKKQNFTEARKILNNNTDILEKQFEQINHFINHEERKYETQNLVEIMFKEYMNDYRNNNYENTAENPFSDNLWDYLTDFQQKNVKIALSVSRKKLVIEKLKAKNYDQAIELMQKYKNINFGENLENIAKYLYDYANELEINNTDYPTCIAIYELIKNSIPDADNKAKNLRQKFNKVSNEINKNNFKNIQILKLYNVNEYNFYQTGFQSLTSYYKLSNKIKEVSKNYNEKIQNLFDRKLDEINNYEDHLEALEILDKMENINFNTYSITQKIYSSKTKHKNAIEDQRRNQELIKDANAKKIIKDFDSAINILSKATQTEEVQNMIKDLEIQHEKDKLKKFLQTKTKIDYYINSALEEKKTNRINIASDRLEKAKELLPKLKTEINENNKEHEEIYNNFVSTIDVLDLKLNPKKFWSKYSEEEKFFKWCISEREKDDELSKYKPSWFDCFKEKFIEFWASMWETMSILVIACIIFLAPLSILYALFTAYPTQQENSDLKEDSFALCCDINDVKQALKEGRFPKGYDPNESNLSTKIAKNPSTNPVYFYLRIKYYAVPTKNTWIKIDHR